MLVPVNTTSFYLGYINKAFFKHGELFIYVFVYFFIHSLIFKETVIIFVRVLLRHHHASTAQCFGLTCLSHVSKTLLNRNDIIIHIFPQSNLAVWFSHSLTVWETIVFLLILATFSRVCVVVWSAAR